MQRKTPKFGASFGLGLAALGRPGYINLGHKHDMEGRKKEAQLENHTHEMLDKAWALGIRHFDAARSYGKAEQFLGSWLKAHPERRRSLLLSSKWGYTYTANWRVKVEVHEVKEHTLANLRKQWPESCHALGCKPDIYQIHSATLDTGVLDNTGVLDELARIKGQGVKIGFSTSGPRQSEIIRKALQVQHQGQHLFGAVQATFNLLETSAGDALREAHSQGLTVIVKEAVANGRLTSRALKGQVSENLQGMAGQARLQQVGLDALALAFVARQPFADRVLSGASTYSQLRQNMDAKKVFWDGDMEMLAHAMAEIPTEYWEKRKQLPWN